MTRQAYPTDLTDAQLEIVAPLLPPPRHQGRPRQVDLREILNGIFYALRSGCPWRMLPHDFPNWRTTYGYFYTWRREGIWDQIQDALRRQVRTQAGREESPSAAIIDSQSVKTTEQGGTRGYDAGKKVNGRKRHIIVDTLGLLLAVVVHAAHIQDRDGAKWVFLRIWSRFPRLQLIWADGGYAGHLVEWVKTFGGWLLEIVRKDDQARGFQVLPKRWIVQRTLAWLSHCRRLSKDYERLCETSEAWIQVAMIHLMLRRLAPS
jgi:putative transposase